MGNVHLPQHQIPFIKYQVHVSTLLIPFLAIHSQLGYHNVLGSERIFSYPSSFHNFKAGLIGVFPRHVQGRRRRLLSTARAHQFSFEIKMTSHFSFSSSISSPRDCSKCSAPPKVTPRVPDPAREVDGEAVPAAAILPSSERGGSKVMERRRRESLID